MSFPPYRYGSIKGTQGEPLISWLLLPPGYRQGERLPTVVLIYPGGTVDAYYPSRKKQPLGKLHYNHPELLPGAGYAMLIANVPLDRSELPRDPLDGLAARVFSAVDAAIAAGYVDPERMGVLGESYGGYAVAGLIGQTDRFKAAVALAGVYDLMSVYGLPRIGDRLTMEYEGRDLFMALGWAETGQGSMGAPPWRDPQRYLRNSPLMQVESIHTPLLLMHGDLDDTIHFTQSDEMFTALYRLNKDAVFLRYWGEGHGIASPPNIRDMWRRILAFYGEHIGPPFAEAQATR